MRTTENSNRKTTLICISTSLLVATPILFFSTVANAAKANVVSAVIGALALLFPGLSGFQYDSATRRITTDDIIIAQATGVFRDQAYAGYVEWDENQTYTTHKVSELWGYGQPIHHTGTHGGAALMDRFYIYTHWLDNSGQEYFTPGWVDKADEPTMTWGEGEFWDVPFYVVTGDYTNPTGNQELRRTPPRNYTVEVKYILEDLSIDQTGQINATTRLTYDSEICELDDIQSPVPQQVNLLEPATQLYAHEYPVAYGSCTRTLYLELDLETPWWDIITEGPQQMLVDQLAQLVEDWEINFEYQSAP